MAAFETHPVTPYPVVGYARESLNDDNREVLIWYPVDPEVQGKPSESPWDLFNVAANAAVAGDKQLPVVALSHGYQGNPHELSWLIRGLVHNGYIVLGIQHEDLIQGKKHVNIWMRAGDISRLIDRFTELPLSKRANLEKIAVTGFSLGGTTAIWIAGGRATKLDSLMPGPEYADRNEFSGVNEGLPTLNKEMMSKDWRDKRVKAAFVMAPSWAWLFDEASLSKIAIPTYLIAAESDKMLMTNNNAGFFARFIPKAFYQPIYGKGGHFIFLSALNETQRKKADPSNQFTFLFEDDPTVDRKWIQDQVVEEAVDFFNWALKKP